jgi:hypothetical protein
MKPQIFYFLLFLFIVGLFSFLVIGPTGLWLENLWLRSGVLLLLAGVGSWAIRNAFRGLSWVESAALSALTIGTFYKVIAFLPDISTYPFSLGWSEVSRYYYASLFLSEQIYGMSVPTSVLHPSRYLMQAIPFLFYHETPLWLHRLWQVLLWLGFSAWAALLLVHRLKDARPGLTLTQRIALGMWAFLFLFQGPVYYHLSVMIILVLWGFDQQRFWKSLVVVLIASLWAGISRVNWLPVPGMLAAALYLLETCLPRKPYPLPNRGLLRSLPLWRYLLPPAAWTLLGTGVAYLSQIAYQAFSGNPPEFFGSSFTSDLLWYRLLPNPTYPLGILPSAVLVSAPLGILILLRAWETRGSYHFIRLLGLSAILFVLFAGGIVVSVKIGGGSNLHNLDAFLALFMVIGAVFILGGARVDQPGEFPCVLRSYPLLTALTVSFPIIFAITAGGVYPQRDFIAAQAALDTLKQNIQVAQQNGGEVLFITQRHLITLKTIKNVKLVQEAELVFLMEMAMADNRPYLEAWYQDLQSNRYSLVVTNPIKVNYQGRAHSFGEENDAWVARVAEPLLCYYEPILSMENLDLQLLAPRAQPCAEDFYHP